jgi:uncharacterized membrane protein required for colicin V production
MDLNLFDYLILTIIAFSGWSGFRKGFLHALGSIISLAVGIMLSIMYYRNLAAYLQDYYGVTGSLAESCDIIMVILSKRRLAYGSKSL